MKRLALMILAVWLGACSGPQKSGGGEEERVIGQPPAPEDDPFGFMTMPLEAQRVATSGVIGSADDKSKKAQTSREPDPERAGVQKPSTEKPVAVAAVTKPAEKRPSRRSETQCFSCVRICPIVSGRADCQAVDDVICGWGVHPERSSALRLAEAECKGALDIAAGSTRYSTIEGSCPPATCE